MISQFKNSGSVEPKKRSGRPRKFTDRDIRKVIRECIKKPEASSQSIANTFNCNNSECNKSISAESVRKILFKRGFKSYIAKKKPFLTKKMIKKRMDFCKKYSSMTTNDWSNVIYSDESYIEINMGCIMNRIRRCSFQNPYAPKFTAKTSKHPLKVMIWGCFNRKGPGRIYVCKGNMNSDQYLTVMETKLLPSINDFGLQSNITHLDDSARPHRSKKIIDRHARNFLHKIDWPGNSPDLNPIENLWAILKQKLRKMRNLNERELISNIINVWYNCIPKETFENLSDSMPNRIQKVLSSKDQQTKY